MSPERVLAELTRAAEGPAPARAVALLFTLGVLELLPGLRNLCAGTIPLSRRVEALGRLTGNGPARFFTALLRIPAGDPGPALAAFAELRPSRALHQRVGRTLELVEALHVCLDGFARGEERRAAWIRLVRAAEFADALAVHAAWHPCEHERTREALVRRAAGLEHDQLWPTPLVTSEHLARAGIPRGPRWTELLRAAEDAQLEGELATPEQVRAWLARHA